MIATLTFDVIHQYDSGIAGISLPLELKRGDRAITLTAKLDTGSSFCIFKREYGEELGVDIERGEMERIATATGSFMAYGHAVTLSTLGFELDVLVYFAAIPNFPRNVLGRLGWMQQLKLGIVDYEGQLFVGSYAGQG